MEAFDLYSPEIDADPFPYYADPARAISLLLERERQALDPVALRRHRAGGARLGDILVVARQHDRRASRPRRRDARHDRSAPPRPAAGVEPGRVHAQEHRAPDRADARDRRPRARPHLRRQDTSSSSTISPARSPSASCSAPWACPTRDHADIRRKVILAVSTDKAVKGRNRRAHRRLQGAQRLSHRRGRGAAQAIRPTI